MSVFESRAKEKMAYISRDYEVFGTCINTDYYDGVRSGVLIHFPNNILKAYATLGREKLHSKDWYDITRKGKDRKANTWYTLMCITNGEMWFNKLAE